MIPGNNVRAWTPAPARKLPSPFLKASPNLGQTASDIITSPLTAIATDIIILAGSTYMWWGLSSRQNRWGTFWAVVSSMTVLKLLHDSGKV